MDPLTPLGMSTGLGVIPRAEGTESCSDFALKSPGRSVGVIFLENF